MKYGMTNLRIPVRRFEILDPAVDMIRVAARDANLNSIPCAARARAGCVEHGEELNLVPEARP
jgi:hypothetical protein